MEEQNIADEPQSAELDPQYEQASTRARRTAFVARFIVLRESKRTRAHRVIEMMDWDDQTTAEELAERFRQVFRQNGDNMMPVERDIRRALAHSSRSLNYFVKEYNSRATLSFIDSLFDYERSNTLLFGADEQPKPGGWRLPKELLKEKAKAKQDSDNGTREKGKK
jgi:hypothetical protein